MNNLSCGLIIISVHYAVMSPKTIEKRCTRTETIKSHRGRTNMTA